MMRRLAYLPLALAVLSSNFAPHGMAQNPDDGFKNDAADLQFLQRIPLNHANAQGVEQAISKLFPSVSIATDQQTNTVYVRADDKTWQELGELAEAMETEAKAQQKTDVLEEEKQRQRGREMHAQAENDAEAAEKLALRDNALKLSEIHDEKFLLEMLRVFIEPKGGKFKWNADERLLVGTYPAELHEMFTLLVLTTFNNPQAAPSDWPAHLPNPDAQQTLRRAALELEELRAKYGPAHPKVRKHERTAESFLTWINTDFPGKFDSLFGRPKRLTDSLDFSPDAGTFHQHEETAASLAAELHELRSAASTPELDAKRAEVEGQLNAAVNAAFSARQELQKAEASALRKQLERIEGRIERRAGLRQRIVARRVKELLQTSDEDAWDPAPAAEQFSRSTPGTNEEYLEGHSDSIEIQESSQPVLVPDKEKEVVR